MEKIKVLLVDDNLQLLESLQDFFSNKNDIEVCGLAEDGQHAIECLQNTSTDVLILDIIMPNLDGMAVLDWLSANKEINFPDVIIVSALRHEDIVRITSMKGVKYFMTKPISYEQLYKRIMELRNVKETAKREIANTAFINPMTIDEEITSIFLSIGIPAHFKGYQFLREGVKMMVEKRAMKNITQELYPIIADHFRTTPSKVESAMRHAINISWTQGKLENINKIFGCDIINIGEKPTNGRFIALIAERILSQKRQAN